MLNSSYMISIYFPSPPQPPRPPPRGLPPALDISLASCTVAFSNVRQGMGEGAVEKELNMCVGFYGVFYLFTMYMYVSATLKRDYCLWEREDSLWNPINRINFPNEHTE